MKGFKIFLIICFITLMTCNRDGFQDYYDNFKKKVGNLRDSASKKLQELDLGAEYQYYKHNI